MAGGKESPRQKMIGMMYLVLTAMLALNVSAEIIEKFLRIDESLAVTVDESISRGEAKLGQMASQIKENGNNPKDIKVLDDAKAYWKEAMDMIAVLDDAREKCIGPDGRDETGKIAKPDKKDLVEQYLLKKGGLGYELQTKLNKFTERNNAILKGFGAKESELLEPLAANPEPKKGEPKKDWVFFNFEETPLAAVLATLQERKQKVLEQASIVLSRYGEQVGITQVKFDKVEPVLVADSKTVTAGTEFKGKLYLTAFNSSLDPEMYMGDTKLPVSGGIGTVSFRASGGAYNSDGIATATQKFKIVYHGQEFEKIDTYYVAKPVIAIYGEAISQLYMQCDNSLQVSCPSLGSGFNPSFSATSGARVTRGAKAGDVVVYPVSRSPVTLNVSNSGAALGSETFKVRPVPAPGYEISLDGRPWNPSRPTRPPRALGIKLVPDAGFYSALPREARFNIASGVVEHIRNGRVVGSVPFSGTSVNLGRLNGVKGDRYNVKILRVVRATGKGEVVPADPGSNTIFAIAID